MDDNHLFFLKAAGQFNRQYHNQRIDKTLKAAESLAINKTDPQLDAACKEMESLFINHLIQEMRATIDKSGFISGGRAEEIFTSMLDVELSRKISAAGGIGLSTLLLEQLSRITARQAKSDLP
ncbi:MAG: rod-binding protein [Desulfobacterales bacterium]|nr:MAG: rod-binding protein [Desulfobacterales bacterium]